MLLIKYMNKNLKIILFITIIIATVSAFFYFSFRVINDKPTLKSWLKFEENVVEEGKVVDVADASLMTLDERLEFNISPTAKVEVWSRDDNGKILVYKQISEEDYEKKMSEIEQYQKYDTNKSGAKVEILNDEDEHRLGLFHLGVYEVVARNENGGISAYRYLKVENEKEIPLEWLNEEEKANFDINPNQRVQLLKRGESGKILAYKIINNDTEIMTRY